jgi:hypothetical protein
MFFYHISALPQTEEKNIDSITIFGLKRVIPFRDESLKLNPFISRKSGIT